MSILTNIYFFKLVRPICLANKMSGLCYGALLLAQSELGGIVPRALIGHMMGEVYGTILDTAALSWQ